MNAQTEISNSDDVIDSRDVIARIEELREQLDADPKDDDKAELLSLETLGVTYWVR